MLTVQKNNPRAKQVNRQKRQEQILDTALLVFARDSYPATTISELVTEARVSRGTFYLYFQSKKDVFDSLLDRFLNELLQILSQFNPFQNKSTDMNHFSHELADCLFKNRLLTKIVWQQTTTLDESHQNKLHDYMNQCLQLLTHRLDASSHDHITTIIDTTVMANCFLGSLKELILNYESNALWELQDQLNSLTGLIQRGFAIPESQQHASSTISREEATFLEETLRDPEYH